MWKPNQGETGALMILPILTRWVILEEFTVCINENFFFQSLDEDYNILSKLKKSSKNVHAAGLSMFFLLFVSALRVHVLTSCIANPRVSLRLNAYLAPAQL